MIAWPLCSFGFINTPMGCMWAWLSFSRAA
jgi:hypothetical protein